MLNMNSSRIEASTMFPLSGLVASVREGAALIGVMEGGIMTAKEAAGANTETFLGFGMSQIISVTEAPKVEELSIPGTATYTLTLAKTPLNPTTEVGVQVIDANGLVLSAMTYNATLATGVFSIAGSVVTFHSSDAGKKVRITYRYALTAQEAAMIYGQGVGDGAQSTIQAVGAIRRAPIMFTDMFDPSDNWAAGGKVYTAAGGRVSLKNTGTLLPGVMVMQAPSLGNNAMLGLSVSV